MIAAQPRPKLTGHDIAARAGVPVIVAETNAYHWWRRCIFLRPSVAHGCTELQQLVAAHEVAHHAQNNEMHWLKWCLWFVPLRLWSEADAWRRAVEMLA
jgi:hypothetical protein